MPVSMAVLCRSRRNAWPGSAIMQSAPGWKRQRQFILTVITIPIMALLLFMLTDCTSDWIKTNASVADFGEAKGACTQQAYVEAPVVMAPGGLLSTPSDTNEAKSEAAITHCMIG